MIADFHISLLSCSVTISTENGTTTNPKIRKDKTSLVSMHALSSPAYLTTTKDYTPSCIPVVYYWSVLLARRCVTVVDGVWDDWTDWSTCNATCGGGTKYRTRNCDGPYHGGQDCVGEPREVQFCSDNPCPGESSHEPQYCLWRNWFQLIAVMQPTRSIGLG